jgi:hypothetical protein
MFLCIDDAGLSPEYFICTSAEARDRTSDIGRAVVDLSGARDEKYCERWWDKIEDAFRPVHAPLARGAAP